MEKKEYVEPSMCLILGDSEDIIRTSGIVLPDDEW
jgi:hypothetical protein